jgi:hypothetical protein
MEDPVMQGLVGTEAELLRLAQQQQQPRQSREQLSPLLGMFKQMQLIDDGGMAAAGAGLPALMALST